MDDNTYYIQRLLELLNFYLGLYSDRILWFLNIIFFLSLNFWVGKLVECSNLSWDEIGQELVICLGFFIIRILLHCLLGLLKQGSIGHLSIKSFILIGLLFDLFKFLFKALLKSLSL